MGYDAERELWMVVNPDRTGMDVAAVRGEEADRCLDLLAGQASHILRVPVRRDQRSISPAVFSCVGAIKALLGIRCGALGPRALFRHLLATGAEPVEVPRA